MSKKVLILTGPGGAGKTTIAELLVKKYNFIMIDGDNLDTEFFPKGNQWLPENLALLRRAHDKILKEVKVKFDEGENNVVLDYIIFGDYFNFINKFKKEFGDKLKIKVLFPSEEEIIKRDQKRECWTTGVDRIRAIRKDFERLKEEIGQNNYIDTSSQTPEETAELIFNL